MTSLFVSIAPSLLLHPLHSILSRRGNVCVLYGIIGCKKSSFMEEEASLYLSIPDSSVVCVRARWGILVDLSSSFFFLLTNYVRCPFIVSNRPRRSTKQQGCMVSFTHTCFVPPSTPAGAGRHRVPFSTYRKNRYHENSRVGGGKGHSVGRISVWCKCVPVVGCYYFPKTEGRAPLSTKKIVPFLF